MIGFTFFEDHSGCCAENICGVSGVRESKDETGILEHNGSLRERKYGLCWERRSPAFSL